MIRIKKKRFSLSGIHQHDWLGDSSATDDTPAITHYFQPAGAWSSKQIVFLHQRLLNSIIRA
ncbi:MAG: hypothetical protein A2511_16810 [Deltaproteobacteria bacterium RIFOXYD12_FULL_50_9]|nr:MAG: hypothetical protein A2511_16810 [Deltaproteobacteria bacterium RIFOXYD12_FULL_50_9]